ncbi:MAG: hypothetical protein IJ165_13890 [Proteobacteria bacterium]|nr:hypothetical protein [Pseudomonadota bacterium]
MLGCQLLNAGKAVLRDVWASHSANGGCLRVWWCGKVGDMCDICNTLDMLVGYANILNKPE